MNLYFIHIPKHGGSFIQNVLKGSNVNFINGGHSGYNDITPNHTVLSSIRNPFDLIVSLYFHGPPNNPYGFNNFIKTLNIKSFEHWVEVFCDPRTNWNSLQSSHDWPFRGFIYNSFYDDNENPIVDYIIRFEQIEDGISNFLKLNNFPIPKGFNNYNKNVSFYRKERDYRKYYDTRLVDIVNLYCEKELNLFNYNFEDGCLEKKSLIKL